METILHEYRCDRVECRKRFDVITEVQTGFSIGIDLRCPHCGLLQKERAPGKIAKIHAIPE